MTVTPHAMQACRFDQALQAVGRFPLTAEDLATIQVNVGLMCNQACAHCHLSCSPQRTEAMTWATMKRVCELAAAAGSARVDITGGEPSLHPLLGRFIDAIGDTGAQAQLRTNLTGLGADGNEELPAFLADRTVQIVGSPPCYLADNVDAQRGPGAYDASMRTIRRLNELGYGHDPDRRLDLVFNPAEAELPPPQAALEADYRAELDRRYGVSFTRLLVITNMPIGRFQTELVGRGDEDDYADLLSRSFSAETVPGLMCRHQVSVRWDGRLFDCDFNLAMSLPMAEGLGDRIDRCDPDELACRQIATGEHCFGCTAGAGSSCSGALL